MRIELNSPIRFIYATDIHLSAHPIGRRVDDYEATILDKVCQWRDLCVSNNAIGLCGGDVFHHKKPKAAGNSLDLIRKIVAVFRQFPHGKVFGCVGNHDLSWDRWDSIPHQPIGILIAAGVYENVADEPLFVTSNNVSVKVDSFPFTENRSFLTRHILLSGRQDSDCHIGLIHAYGNTGSGGGKIGYDPIPYSDLQTADYDIMLWGHDHAPLETTNVGGIKHIRPGSLARAALESDNMDRPVSVVSIEVDPERRSVKTSTIPLSVKPFDSVFSIASKAVETSRKSSDVDDFFTTMDSSVADIEVSDPKAVLAKLCPEDEPEVLKTALALCEL